MNQIDPNNEIKCYQDLCNSYLHTSVIQRYSCLGVNVDIIVTRIILENCFDISLCKDLYYKNHNYSSLISFDIVDKPLFFHIGLKSIPFSKKIIREMSKINVNMYDKLDDENFIKLCQYIIAKPYDMYTKLKPSLCMHIKSNKYLITLLLFSQMV